MQCKTFNVFFFECPGAAGPRRGQRPRQDIQLYFHVLTWSLVIFGSVLIIPTLFSLCWQWQDRCLAREAGRLRLHAMIVSRDRFSSDFICSFSHGLFWFFHNFTLKITYTNIKLWFGHKCPTRKGTIGKIDSTLILAPWPEVGCLFICDKTNHFQTIQQI